MVVITSGKSGYEPKYENKGTILLRLEREIDGENFSDIENTDVTKIHARFTPNCKINCRRESWDCYRFPKYQFSRRVCLKTFLTLHLFHGLWIQSKRNRTSCYPVISLLQIWSLIGTYRTEQSKNQSPNNFANICLS